MVVQKALEKVTENIKKTGAKKKILSCAVVSRIEDKWKSFIY